MYWLYNFHTMEQQNTPYTIRAFSLVELSIVLVILGLITGSVLAGQALIKAAELRAVTIEIANFRTSTLAFADKYHALPGDMTNATAFWGDNATHCADAAIADGTPGVCNGNGDGTIIEQAAAAGEESEGHMFWLHLQQAGLIDGTFTGLAGPAGLLDDVPGTNAPVSSYENGCYHIDSDNTGNGERYEVSYGVNMLELGADQQGGDRDCDFRLMPAEDAWQLDKKLDDGLPAHGNIIAKYWNDLCATVNSGTHTRFNLDARYKVEDTTNQCSLILRNFIN